MCPQKLVIRPYPDPNQLSSHPQIYVSKLLFYTALLCIPASTNAFLPSSSSGQICVFIFSFWRTCCKVCQSNGPFFITPLAFGKDKNFEIFGF
jgi:hypothetical protein